jgi:uncharacterized protein
VIDFASWECLYWRTKKVEEMRLYKTKIPAVAARILERLVADHDIEVGEMAEAVLDMEAVMREYLRLERELTEESKDTMERRNLSYAQFSRVKRELSERKGVGTGDEVLSWITNQVLEMFMHSPHIEEVFGDDTDMRRKIKDILKSAMSMEDDLDQEVRQRIKNIEEGTAAWDIEYKNKMAEIRRKHGIE